MRLARGEEEGERNQEIVLAVAAVELALRRFSAHRIYLVQLQLLLELQVQKGFLQALQQREEALHLVLI